VFGQSTMIVDGNHRFRDLTKPLLKQGYDYARSASATMPP